MASVSINSIDFNFITIKQENLLNYIESTELFLSLVKYVNILDIKNFNDLDKLILTMFINQYINLNPIISQYSPYSKFLKPQINMLKKKILMRGFYVSTDILLKSKINLSHRKILNISSLPTFIESYITIKNQNIKCENIDFIRIKSKSNKTIYDNIINNFKYFHI